MSERAITFDCRGETLVGILHEPDREPAGWGMLIVVGGPQYRVGSHRQFVLMARSLAAAGVAVFRFDYRGMGDSTGDTRTFEDVGDDIGAAMDAFLKELPALRGVTVFGLCDAASAALMYSHGDSRVCGVVLANPWARTDTGEARARIRHYYARRFFEQDLWKKVVSGSFDLWNSLRGLRAALRRAAARAGRGGRNAVGEANFLDRMEAGLASFAHPVLLIMSGRDLTAREFDDFCRGSRTWTRLMASPRVTRVDLPAADHTFSSEGSLQAACCAIEAWIGAQRTG